MYKKLSNEVMDEVFKQNRTYCVPGFKGLVEASSFLRTALKNKDEKKIIEKLKESENIRPGASDKKNFFKNLFG